MQPFFWYTMKYPNRHFNKWNVAYCSVVCTLIDNDKRHHSGQNVVDSF